MKQSRFSEEQIIGILKQQEAGCSTADVCREADISNATFYAWKAKYGGLSVSDAQRLRQLESENEDSELRRVVADLTLDNVTLKDVLQKNGEAHRQICAKAHGLSQRRADVLVSAPKVLRYKSHRPDKAELHERLRIGWGTSPFWLSPFTRSATTRRLFTQPQKNASPLP